MASNGFVHPSPSADSGVSRADEVADLLDAVQALLIPFIRAADQEGATKSTGHGRAVNGGAPRTTLVEYHSPQKLIPLLNFALPEAGTGKDGILSLLERLLNYSVNTWDQGFLDKLYASTNAVGVASELILSVLNTNLHVYQVSPALTVIEKTTARSLAALFGFNGTHAGGISQPGGSASNTTSIVIARNTLYPESKVEGNGTRRFVLFTSEHGHYSVEKTAQMCGLGSANVWSVPVDDTGRMRPDKLDELIQKAKNEGRTPFYVNATAGTTVLGSYDPFEAIAEICQRHGLWMHVDGSWGGSVIFSEKHKWRLAGVHNANSIAITPHKMLGVPVTCSFLLAADLRQFHAANTLPAGYLFHQANPDTEIWDLADLTLQCGRKGDSLKLALGWIYYGKSGYEARVNQAFAIATYLAQRIEQAQDLFLVSKLPLSCLQVCFYLAPGGKLPEDAEVNSRATKEIAQKLIAQGFMIDYAPGERGHFFRIVVNAGVSSETIDGLLKAIESTSGAR